MKYFLTAFFVMFIGSFAQAESVKMKKAAAEGDKSVNEYIAKFQAACGAKIKVTSQHKDAAALKIPGVESDNLVVTAAKQCGSVLYHMAEVCSDNDYKEELAKITELKCVPKVMESRPFWIPQKSGTTLTFTIHPTTDGSEEGMEALKNLL